ncbi:MAG: hypothetical protein PHQ86_04105 [Dehalococcoidales bacterium]|nr:hypothetical protein [Dehalococcoidales bacterium]
MEWMNGLAGLITVLVFVIGLPLVLRKRNKMGPQKLEQFLHHLGEMGIKAVLAEKDTKEKRIGVGHNWSQRSEGIFKIEGKNIKFINISSVSSQYGNQEKF